MGADTMARMDRRWAVAWSIALGLACACGRPCVDDGLHAKQSGAACLAQTTSTASTGTSAAASTGHLTTPPDLTSGDATDCSCTDASSDATTAAVTGTTTTATTTAATTGAATSDTGSTGLFADCSNLEKDPGETDLDCGGVCVELDPQKTCDDDLGCLGDGDCKSQHCHDDADVCVDMACDNGVHDVGMDYHIDCGGQICPGCGLGLPCGGPDQCAVGMCVAGVCALMGTCHDDEFNDLEESDVDCGKLCGPSCKHEQMCEGPGDCISDSCVDGVCDDPQCKDGVQNGDETDIDCGGSCAPCSGGYDCIADPDCMFAGCFFGKCGG